MYNILNIAILSSLHKIFYTKNFKYVFEVLSLNVCKLLKSDVRYTYT